MKHQFLSKTEKTKLHVFTPDECKFYLGKYNKGNRKLRKNNIQRLSASINNGTFVLTTSGVGFDTHGNMTNGQHRFDACVNTGKPIKIAVVYGLAPETKINEDGGASRTLVDNVVIDGNNITSVFAQIGTNWYRYLNNWITQGQTPRELLQAFLIEKEEYITPIATIAKKRQGLGKVGFLMACAVYAEKHTDKAVAFAKEVIEGVKADGTGLRQYDAAFRLRDHLTSSRGGGGSRITENAEKTFWAIYAWNNNLPCPKLGRKTKLEL